MTNSIEFPSEELQLLYSKTLFNTISVNELNRELLNAEIYSENDTFALKTLKLRLYILKLSSGPDHLIQSIEEEMKRVNQTRYQYKCCVPGCCNVSSGHRKYVSHFKLVHSRMCVSIVCKLHGCVREFTTIAALKRHISLQHWKQKDSAVVRRQDVFVSQLLDLRCLSVSCGRSKVSSVSDLKNHLVTHFKNGEKVACIFEGCTYMTENRGSMRSHFSRSHPVQDVSALKSDISNQNPVTVAFSQDLDSGGLDNDQFSEAADQSTEYDISEEDDTEELDTDDVFTKSLAICFNTWMNISGIPYSTVNDIVREIFSSYEKGAKVTRIQVQKILVDEGISPIIINRAMEALDSNNPFEKAKEELMSEYKRKQYIEESFPYVKPVSVRLSMKNEKAVCYQYVPIKQTLKLLLEDKTYIQQLENDPYSPEENIIKDARDGDVMKTNEFFVKNPDAVPLLLFQDELELANPLGSAKVKHKINCTYVTSLTVQSALRGRINSVQLVSLVKSSTWKKYGNLKCNEKLIADLQELETIGIQVSYPCPRIVKGGVRSFSIEY